MASFFKKLFGVRSKKTTEKNSITGRNSTFPVPYLSKLEGNQLQPGQSLIVRGVIIGRDEFIVNLTGGPNTELDETTDRLDNRMLSIRAIISEGRITLNACIDGEWGREGSVKHKLRPGDEFDIRVRSMEKFFEIFIDHKLCARFAYYVPISSITHLYINGDVELYSVSWEGKFYQMPYAADIPGNFYVGRKLCVSAFVNKKAKQLTLDFHSGADIALRVNPSLTRKKVFRNTRSGNRWGEEESSSVSPFLFKKNRTFDMLVYCEDNNFVIYVDDCLVGRYAHRMSPDTIDKICIDGDIELHGVHLK
ncbi:hypothetical protein AB6A40_006460 [Gnathostoma spinigerum]|uniref:Galectin n=1 Tax=Gnathostoma spinigerum TaxID=75299 RepID=A0ABD6EQP5_9BILA